MTRNPEPLSIVVTGDVLRPTASRFAPSQSGNITWLYTLLRGVISRGTGKEVKKRLWEDLDIPFFYECAGAEPNITGWGELSDRRHLPPELDCHLGLHFGGSFVIGFEMPRVLCLALDRIGVFYINLTIHPVRFLNDIYFGMATNHPDIFAALNGYAIPERDIQRGAEIVLAHVVKRPVHLPVEARMLILGQVAHDRALISNGRFVSFVDYAETLRDHVAEERNVLFKRHPYSKNDLNLFLSGIPKHKVHSVNRNFYELMASEEITKVLSLTSGGTYEARYFEKTPIHLGAMQSQCVEPGTEFHPDAHLGIFEGFLDEDFWRAACAPVMSVTATDGYHYQRPPNTLRIALGDFWGFNQITTDRVVTLARS